MQPIPAFLISLAGTTVLAALVSLALLRPMLPLLAELCGTPARARFWAVFTVCGTVLTVLFMALVTAPNAADRAKVSLDVFDVFVGTARSGILGLLLAVGVLGMVLLSAIGRFEAQRRFREIKGQQV